MKKKTDPDMLSEYDFSRGVRGKYAKRFSGGINLIALSPDLAQVFPDSKSVNDVLRTLVNIARKKVKKAA